MLANLFFFLVGMFVGFSLFFWFALSVQMEDYDE